MFNSLVAKKGEELEPSFRKAGDIFDDDYYGALLKILSGGPADFSLDPAVEEALKTQKSQMDAGISGTFVPVESNYGGMKY